jgi:hypothetical protein
MVIHYLHIFGACDRPTKAETILLVDSNTVLTGPIASQYFKPVAGWHPKVVKTASDLQLPQLTARNSLDIREPLDT